MGVRRLLKQRPIQLAIAQRYSEDLYVWGDNFAPFLVEVHFRGREQHSSGGLDSGRERAAGKSEIAEGRLTIALRLSSAVSSWCRKKSYSASEVNMRSSAWNAYTVGFALFISRM
ncbi:uncharacterized protein SCHCODRAFT_02620691 [Schizophyllum commune H4-8]|uniref:Expressed protein n=1 Tax=Schizophyllum commune (strain H4-8 / FGSC 9210) TaxID=578458 RepID=D8PMV2_SCHCM|nr:uncharacterized protein SCHCODRAFT_02620691 [Schizophyllum commune H4-8]KAI5893038.1 hypothetical protein SCHCODRAFT_02620691 [Schizophyllum commune H4-8]